MMLTAESMLSKRPVLRMTVTLFFHDLFRIVVECTAEIWFGNFLSLVSQRKPVR